MDNGVTTVKQSGQLAAIDGKIFSKNKWPAINLKQATIEMSKRVSSCEFLCFVFSALFFLFWSLFYIIANQASWL